MSKTSKLNFILDADPTVYRQGFAADAWAKSIWPESHETVDYLDKALKLVDYSLERLENVWFPDRDHSWIVLSGKTNFRKELATIKPYKGNRTNKKPKYYDEIREYMMSIGAEMTDGIEADDRVGHIQTLYPDTTCIVSIDKDLNMIPGWKFNPTKEEFKYVTPTEAYSSFFRQMLEGDSTDNIPGIPGIGPKKAALLLPSNTPVQTCIDTIRKAYRETYKGAAEKALSEVAGLLWIQRHENDWCPYFAKIEVRHETPLEVEKGTSRDGDEIGTGSESGEVFRGQGDTIPVRTGDSNVQDTREATPLHT